MSKTLIQAMPQELEIISQNVSAEKRSEVQNVLNHVFNGVSKMREQLESVVVADENDRVNMKLANTIRLGVRQVRLDAEKVFDAKREEVQAQMISYKTEDQLWLKAKQTMQILTKEIEENAKWKESTKERIETERRELKLQQRIAQVIKFDPDIHRSEFENMSDDSFNIFLAGIEKQYNDKIEVELKAEQERIAKEKAEADERERIRIENEQLKAEAQAKEKQFAEERAKAEAERKALEEKARKEKDAADAKLKAEREAKVNAEAELKAKVEAEQKAEKEAKAKAATELKARQDAEKKAKAAPDKVKLNEFANSLDNLLLPDLKSEEAKMILADAKTLLAKVSKFIREKTSNI